MRTSTEAVIGAVTGSLTRPTGVLLGRFDRAGQLRYAGRTTPLRSAAALALAELLTPAAPGHPWAGRRFKAAWSSAARLDTTLVAPELVAEVSADVARDPHGGWRHPVRYLRIRADLEPADTPLFDAGDEPAAG